MEIEEKVFIFLFLITYYSHMNESLSTVYTLLPDQLDYTWEASVLSEKSRPTLYTPLSKYPDYVRKILPLSVEALKLHSILEVIWYNPIHRKDAWSNAQNYLGRDKQFTCKNYEDFVSFDLTQVE